ncbi:MAG: hypothetical protein WBV82_22605 [Myxococcaceae bacterium]
MTHEIMEELTPLARSLVELEQRRPDPLDLPEARIFERLSDTLGLTVPLAPAPEIPTSPSVPGAEVVASGALSKVLIASALLSAGAMTGGGAVYTWMSSNAPAPAAVVAPAPLPVPEALPAVPRQLEHVAAPPPAHVPAPPQPVRKSPARPAPGPASTESSLDKENVLLERARTALLRREPEAALIALEEHVSRHAAGRLSEERDALRVQVLVLLGRRPEAESLARAFRERHPHSLLLPAVDAAISRAP